MRSLSILILFQLQSWIILRVRTKFLLRNFHAKRVIFKIAMINIFKNCIAGSLNKNYFLLNESPSLYWQCFVYSRTAWNNTYVKSHSKTFNALIIATLNKQRTAARVIILIKYTVVCDMPFNVNFFNFLTLNLLGENNQFCFESMN